MKYTLQILGLSLLLGPTLGRALSITDLERNMLDQNRRLEVAIQEVQIASARFAQQEAESGLKLFANMTGGSTVESLSQPGENPYIGTYGYTFGASYPLLGSRAKQNKKIHEARELVEISKLDVERIKKLALIELRKAYLDLWIAEELERLSQEFLSERKTAESLLTQRMQAGLLLASDQQTFSSGFALAEAQLARSRQLAAISRQHISLLTAVPPERITVHTTPNFDPILERKNNIDTDDPEVQVARLRLDNQYAHLEHPSADGIEASIDLSYSDGRQYWNPTVPSSIALATLTLRMPVNILQYRKAVQDENIATLYKYRADYDEQLQRRNLESQEALDAYREALGNLNTAEIERNAALQALHERTLRSQSLPGDELEKRLQARYQYFRMASQLLDFWRKTQYAGIRLASYGYEFTASPISPPLDLSTELSVNIQSDPKAITPVNDFAIPVGVYIWHSHNFLQAPALNLEAVKKSGLSRILIGLDNKQVRDPNLTKYIKQLVNIAHQKQIKVELVLGDPDWIIPEQRPDLIVLLKRLSPLSVDGINLDLEIEQLPDWESRRETLVAKWLDTLRAAANVVQSPLGATFHHRHLEEPGFVDRLRSAGVANAAIMIFSTRKDRVLKVATQAQRVLGTLTHSIVQSVERSLPVSESYYTKGLNPLVSLSQALKGCCHTTLILQAWDDLRIMKP
jgi:outer membrane protein TolC